MRMNLTADQIERSRLPRPIRTNQARNAPLLNFQIEVRNSMDPAIIKINMGEGEHSGFPKPLTDETMRACMQCVEYIGAKVLCQEEPTVENDCQINGGPSPTSRHKIELLNAVWVVEEVVWKVRIDAAYKKG